MSDSKTTPKESAKTRYSRTIIGFMTSDEAFASAKNIGIKISGEPIPYITNEGDTTTTSVINVSSTQIMQADTTCDLLLVLQSLVMLNQPVKRTLLNMLLVKGTITFTRELKPAGYVPIGGSEPLSRDCYITEVEKVEATPLPIIQQMVMSAIEKGDIYEPSTTKAINAPIIGGIAPQVPE